MSDHDLYEKNGFLNVRDIHGGVYILTNYIGVRHFFVIDESDQDKILLNLCRAVARMEKNGHIITSVTRMDEGCKANPRVAFRNTKEYKQALEEEL